MSGSVGWREVRGGEGRVGGGVRVGGGEGGSSKDKKISCWT